MQFMQWRLVFRWDEAEGASISTTTVTSAVRRTMQTTKRKRATVREILIEEFMRPLGLIQGALES